MPPGTHTVNVEIARMVAAEFNIQSTLNGVAQAVVDRVVRIHHDSFIGGTPDVKQICQKRGDITLMVRNFNYPLPNAMNSPTASGNYHPVSVPFYQPRTINMPLSVNVPTTDFLYVNTETSSGSDAPSPGGLTPTPAGSSVTDTLTTSTTMGSSTLETNTSGRSYTSTESSTQSSGEIRFPSRYYHRAKLELDSEGKVEAYIDFSEFYAAINRLTEAQRESLNAETKPKSVYDPINEESEPMSAPEN